jgi:carbamoyl-phosphate synthase / aspartate carbamoyltransferase
MSIDAELQTPSDQRLFAIANAMHSGYTVERIWELTQIDKWFLTKLYGLINMAKVISNYTVSTIPIDLVRLAKQHGFADRQLARFIGSNELAVRRLRQGNGITPFVKQIDTVAAEFPAYTNYLYITYNASENDIAFDDHGVMVLGSGVYRIGSSVEFDWCAVRAVRTLRDHGVKTVMVNYNPETVSTDYDEADRLYFENINLETVLDIYEAETASGVIVSMGGQTPNNIALALHRLNVKILGTSPEMIDTAENRFKFSRMLDKIEVDQPRWKELTSFEEALLFCDEITYPVLVRPSYVLSGAAMNTVYSKDDLVNYLKQAAAVNREHPVVISKYIEGAKEIEMDAVAKDGKMLMHFVSEHIENAGVHSGDATLVLPPQDLDPETVRRIEIATQKIANALNVTGPFNIQFIAKDNEIKVIECNVRAARSFPFVSKVMGIDMIELATNAILEFPVQAYPPVEVKQNYVGVKVPQFSFSRLSGADPVLGVEMASTGEVACFGHDKFEAYLKALISTGFRLPEKNILLSIGSFKEKMEMLPSIRRLHEIGYKLFATAGTSDFIQEHGIPCQYLETLNETGAKEQKSEYSLTQHLANNTIDLYINLPSNNRFRRPANYMSSGYRTRRLAVDFSIPLVTNVKCAKLLVEAISRNIKLEVSDVDFQSSHRTVSLPGLINIAAFVPGIAKSHSSDFEEVTQASVAAGFSMIRILPVGLDESLTDLRAISAAHSNTKNNAHCDFNISVAATSNNAQQLSQVISEVGSLFIPFNHLSNNVNRVAAMASHFAVWPPIKPIVTDAETTDLASILLLASLHNRPVHIHNVVHKHDIALIALSKEKGLQVTCDVCVYALFLSRDDFPDIVHLPSSKDQKALWEHMDTIDCFSIGSLPYYVAHKAQKHPPPTVGIADTLPLLLTAVADGRLTLDDITQRLRDNPKRIFDLHEQPESSMEVEVDRRFKVPEGKIWSPFVGMTLTGVIRRVVFGGQTVYLDGEITSTRGQGKDMSGIVPIPRPSTRDSTTSSSAIGFPKRRGTTVEVTQLRSPMLRAADHLYTSPPPIPPQGSLLAIPPRVPGPSLAEMISHTPFYRKHIISVKQFDRNDLHLLFSIAQEMRTGVERQGVLNILQGRLICTMFFEPSTRTSSSFEAAMQRLGGKVVSVTASASSVTKGESVADTIRTLACYSDAIVMRHPSAESIHIAASVSPVPIINGGNGSVEHPTQAFLDLYTIREELGTVNGLTITFVGDLKFGRTVHSLIRLLLHYQVRVNLVSPPQLALPEEVKLDLQGRMELHEYTELTSDVVARTDVLYGTRVQKERFESEEEYERLKSCFIIDNRVLRGAKKSMIVMHPLPRNQEISEEVDFDQVCAQLTF